MGFESVLQRIWRESKVSFADVESKTCMPTKKCPAESPYLLCGNGWFPAFGHTTIVRAPAHEAGAGLGKSS